MSDETYWQRKLVQLLHDPPGKAADLRWHEKRAREMLEAALGKETADRLWEERAKVPDRAAAGADRAVLRGWVQFTARGQGIITHPLAEGGSHLQPRRLADNEIVDLSVAEVRREDREAQLEAIRAWGREVDAETQFLRIWRGLEERLVDEDGNEVEQGDALWSLLPADTRQPDHTIWDHTRITAAFSCLEDEHDPWLLALSLTPVQTFIAEARTSRDLWVGSMLVADLAFEAMKVVIDRFGPDHILSTDLRGNPLADRWLYNRDPDDEKKLLPPKRPEPRTYAALVPHRFVAIVPGTCDASTLAADCVEAVRRRWKKHADSVLAWLRHHLGDFSPEPWERIWERQLGPDRMPLRVRWTATRWRSLEHGAAEVGALPGQVRSAIETARAQHPIGPRPAHFTPWVSPTLWGNIEHARRVFEGTARNILRSSGRGFDYGLALARLQAMHELQKQTPQYPPFEEPGEKCTLCQAREALRAPRNAERDARDDVDGQRRQARNFWATEALDPNETGAERLCGVCALKRFVVQADDQYNGFNATWAGPRPPLTKEARVPFPSTSMIAAQDYLAQVATHGSAPLLAEIVEAHKGCKLTRTAWPESLYSLTRVSRTLERSPEAQTAREFLQIDPQETIFPQALAAQLRIRDSRGRDAGAGKSRSERLVRAVAALRKDTAQRFAKDERTDVDRSQPGRRIAVIAIDGDAIGRILRGDPEVIGAKWADVLHPRIVAELRNSDRARAAGWGDLLRRPRLVGPSLHAVVSRALSEFAHRIVPWVVEREFGGRLVYAGGDDALALAPAEDALHIVARLQQLYSAAWLVDTNRRADAWNWRDRIDHPTVSQQEARKRFRALATGSGDGPTPVPVPPERLRPHVFDQVRGTGAPPAGPVSGPVIPMMGGHSLSAAVTIAHFKHPLGALVRRTRELLENEAKGRAGRAALAVSHYSRGGSKSVFAIRWADGSERGTDLSGYQALARVLSGFRAKHLPGNLPYKLREVAPIVATALRAATDAGRDSDAGKRHCEAALQLATGFVAEALGKPDLDALGQSVVDLWWAGFMQVDGDAAERSVDGLLFGRALASEPPEEDEE
jgi:CRISPR-associated protein Cmr2